MGVSHLSLPVRKSAALGAISRIWAELRLPSVSVVLARTPVPIRPFACL